MDICRASRSVFFAIALVIALGACGEGERPVLSGGDGDASGAQVDGPDGPDGNGPDGGGSDAPVATTPPVTADPGGDSEPGGDPDPSAEPTAQPEPTAEPTPRPTDEPTSVPTANPTTAPTAPTEVPEPTPPIDDGIGWKRISSAPDVLDPGVRIPDELLMAADGRTVLVRFWNGVEPCSVARVTVVETGAEVQVKLETGANPEAATMTCIALAEAYEIAVPLADPLGDRRLVAVNGPANPPTDPTEPPDDAVYAVDYYVGLTEAEAVALADQEGRVLRVARRDGEWFALTEDFRPSRVNIEVDAGVVTSASGG